MGLPECFGRSGSPGLHVLLAVPQLLIDRSAGVAHRTRFHFRIVGGESCLDEGDHLGDPEFFGGRAAAIPEDADPEHFSTEPSAELDDTLDGTTGGGDVFDQPDLLASNGVSVETLVGKDEAPGILAISVLFLFGVHREDLGLAFLPKTPVEVLRDQVAQNDRTFLGRDDHVHFRDPLPLDRDLARKI